MWPHFETDALTIGDLLANTILWWIDWADSLDAQIVEQLLAQDFFRFL